MAVQRYRKPDGTWGVLQGGGAGEGAGGTNNIFTLFAPYIIDDTMTTLAQRRAIVDGEHALEIPNEIKVAWYNIIDNYIAHNQQALSAISSCYLKGEDVVILLEEKPYVDFYMEMYIYAIDEYGEYMASVEELLFLIEQDSNVKKYKMGEYEISPPSEDTSVVTISYSTDELSRVMSIDATGDWIETVLDYSKEIVYPIIYDNGNGLSEVFGQTNLTTLGRNPKLDKIQIEYAGEGISFIEKYTIIDKGVQYLVSDFPTLDGGVQTTDIVQYRFLADLEIFELQVSKKDGYCRKVSLGTISLTQ